MAVVDKTVFDSQMWRNEMHFVWLSLQKGLSEHCELQYDEFGFRMDTEGNYCVLSALSKPLLMRGGKIKTFILHRWWGLQVLAKDWRLTSAWRSPAATAMASTPGVHTQSHSGGPDLGSDRSCPSTLGSSTDFGVGGHPSYHEASGAWIYTVVRLTGLLEYWNCLFC